MATRSFSSRLVIGSALWTVGLIALAVLIATAVIHHSPRAAWSVHWTIIGFSAAVLMIAGLAQVQRGLSPFNELRRRLQAVRDGTASQVEGRYPSEVEPLVSDLNALLTHQAAAVSRAQSKAGDLAHGLKTPLAVLAHEANRAAADGHADLAETLHQQIARMQRHITYHLAQARASASAATLDAHASVRASAEGLARVLERAHHERGLTLQIDVDDTHTARVQRADLDEMLGNLMDNACKWAKTRVQVSSARTGGRLAIYVDDDGAGLVADQRAKVLQRGVRADEAAPGTGLGLAIVRDLAEIYGGTVTLQDSPLGGLRAALELPTGDGSEG